MRQRPISSVPDWTLQTAPTTFFRSALTRLLQTTSSILPDENRRADGGKSQPGADQAKSAPGLGRRTAPTHGAKPYSGGVSNCPLGVSLCLMYVSASPPEPLKTYLG